MLNVDNVRLLSFFFDVVCHLASILHTAKLDRNQNKDNVIAAAREDSALIAPWHKKAAHSRFYSIKHNIKKTRLRRAPPPWSAPAEIWRLIFWPSYLWKEPTRPIGYEEQEVDLTNTYGYLRHLFAAMVANVVNRGLLAIC